MEHVVTSAVVAFGALLPIVDPIGNVPAFLGLAAGLDDGQRRRQAALATLFAAVLLVVFFSLGSYLLTLFHVSLAAVEAVGGLVIGYSGWRMLTEDVTVDATRQPLGDDDIAFYPMAFPLLAGPGALALSLGLTNRHDSPLDYVGWAVGIVAICLVCYVALRLAVPLSRRLGPRGIMVVSRLMGLLVLAIGAEMVFNGIADEFNLTVTG
ncbi:MAG TPA: MarC family protein [Nitriliruptoraceae bacterium]|nr:MarC family protein [Nitriliruptoraceae bacterium]